MTKQEFLYALRETLANELNASQVEEHVRYYTSYIDDQISLGHTEAEVLAELGDPRSIAHNIIDGVEAANGEYQSAGTTYTSESAEDKPEWQSKFKTYGIIAAIFLIVFVVLILVTRLIIWALPTIITVAVIVWIIKKINGQ